MAKKLAPRPALRQGRPYDILHIVLIRFGQALLACCADKVTHFLSNCQIIGKTKNICAFYEISFGIQIVLYMTLITALLIRVFEHFTNLGPKLAIFRMENQIILWIRDNHDCVNSNKASGGGTNSVKMDRKQSSYQ
ncbi:MAG: hypothetical protein NC230_09395 [Bacteroides sp.]|nr:hypothetical protein [Bacteroides sp.]